MASASHDFSAPAIWEPNRPVNDWLRDFLQYPIELMPF